jgi:hypothetical protein
MKIRLKRLSAAFYLRHPRAGTRRGNVDHVGEFVRQIACEPFQVVVSPGIVDLIENGFCFCH